MNKARLAQAPLDETLPRTKRVGENHTHTNRMGEKRIRTIALLAQRGGVA